MATGQVSQDLDDNARLRWAVERALELRDAIVDLDDPQIRELIDLILFELGQRLSRLD